MTEYWVSQGNKWCDYCKIYIANNSTSIRTHEFGQRHKENVAKKLTAIRKDNAVKEKEKLQAAKDLEKIEAQARKSYERDLAAIRRADVAAEISHVTVEAEVRPAANVGTSEVAAVNDSSGVSSATSENEWTFDEATGYHFNAATGYFYDPNSGLYYSDILGKWTTQEEALKASQDGKTASDGDTVKGLRSFSNSAPQIIQADYQSQAVSSVTTKKSRDAASLSSAGKETSALVGPVVKKQEPVGVGKGVASSLEVGKRKREEKRGPISGEEAAALAAREAARKRTQEREKSLLGLYQAY
ncbi:WW domain-binding protein 4 [Marchantia polymorpha subsp. ruderalis]|uniref:Matrin-type domain-containing protein n=2 Tax=Marchantia polymorpha TaxID=3197 RepID=A0AAF6B7V1_MARPO|nr:hypothetical protein MARPO_0157s0003 [Marchantia polymorpha]BBN08085.1 hypothetical protein Mp_4g08760 [Marchantia polymorpha subsp. ruderalis]|eukprot:PTQ28671.1 hypothetical protein MARPO_0157s0003 [Marchantia polymorpha]